MPPAARETEQCTMARQPQTLKPQSQRLMLADVTARETLQAAPWICLMQQLVPFSQSVCVAGSVGTWLAEYDIQRTRPLWDPSDIDVFMLGQTRLEYECMCDAFVDSFTITYPLNANAVPIRIAVQRKYHHIRNVQWWVTWNGTEVMCPEFSLIHCPGILCAGDLLDQFDIDICQVAVNVWAGQLGLEMSSEVHSHFHKRHMHGVMRQDPSSAGFHYPMQKTLARIRKYAERGYQFKSLQFMPSNRATLNVADFEFVWLHTLSREEILGYMQ